MKYKVCDGVELLALQGWHFPHDYRDPRELPDNNLATHLAGNAFNGFMFQALFLASNCGSGAVYDQPAATTSLPIVEECSSDSSNESDGM